MNSYILTCPLCGSANRIPSDKEGKSGHCGNCHGILPPLYHHPRELTGADFDDFTTHHPGPVLAEFWAPWCPHCNAYVPAVRIIAERLAGKAVVVLINTQNNPHLATRFGVRGIPVIMLLQNGRVIDQLPGVQSPDTVLAWFKQTTKA